MKPSASTLRLRGSLSILFSASVWGLFWLPLHYFDREGLNGLWAVVAINMAAAAIALPVAFFRGSFDRPALKPLLSAAFGIGAANVFYFAGLILSDVVRVIFLFYLLPIWATLFSRLLLGTPIGPIRMLAIGIAVIGIWLLLGAGGWPIPENLGDISGIAAGMCWALGLTLMGDESNVSSLVATAIAAPTAILLALMLLALSPLLPPLEVPFPYVTNIDHLLLPVLLFGILVLWPTTVGQLWGAKFVSSPTASLLTMSEILVATTSAVLIAGSSLAPVSWAGGGLIVIAVLIDIYGDARQHA